MKSSKEHFLQCLSLTKLCWFILEQIPKRMNPESIAKKGLRSDEIYHKLGVRRFFAQEYG